MSVGEKMPGSAYLSGGETPPDKEPESKPNLVLHIKNEHPSAIAKAIEDQIGREEEFLRIIGEPIGSVKAEDQENPLVSVESRVRGNEIYKRFEEDPDVPEKFHGVGERVKEFYLETRFRLPDHTFVGEQEAKELIRTLGLFGYQVPLLRRLDSGSRELVIVAPEGLFNLDIGWSSADEELDYYRRQMKACENDPARRGLGKYFLREYLRSLEGQDRSKIVLETPNSHPLMGPNGIPFEDRETVVSWLKQFKDLSEAVATALVKSVSQGKEEFPELRMDWLPPAEVKEMETRASS